MNSTIEEYNIRNPGLYCIVIQSKDFKSIFLNYLKKYLQERWVVSVEIVVYFIK